MTGIPPEDFHLPEFREIGWSGLRMKTPKTFQPVTIGPGYLFFSNTRGQPGIELKWAPAGKRGQDPEAYLEKMISRRPSGAKKMEFARWAPPAQWLQKVPTHQAVGFSWREDQKTGAGLILFCPACGTLALIRFFPDPTPEIPDPVPFMLTGFIDHPIHDEILWSLFDIQALLPAAFKLHSYRFDVGRFEMRFSFEKTRLFLYRWAMAKELLKKNPLETWSAGLGMPRDAMLIGSGCHDGEYLDWTALGPKSLWRRRRERHRLRLMHLPEKDRILGLQLIVHETRMDQWRTDSRGAIPRKMDGRTDLDALWASYHLT